MRNYEFSFLQGKENGQLKALPWPVFTLKVHGENLKKKKKERKTKLQKFCC